jgi:putative hydrolase of the HAD superfamily
MAPIYRIFSGGETMIEAVIFDVDGVLVRSGAFGQRLRHELGIPPDELDEFWRGPFVQCSLGLADLKTAIAPFLERWGYRGTVEGCLNEWFSADSALNADVLDAVERLRRRGVPCHVASTQERYRAAYLEGPMGLAARFERLFFSCRLGVKKPQLEFYRRVESELGTPPAALLFIDDQQMNVQAARAAGWSAELYAFGDDVSSLLARHGIVASD